MASLGLQSIHYYHFEQPLAHPFFARHELLHVKEGLIVHVISDKGTMGFGEIAPLPGISPELFKKAVYQADTMARELKGARIPVEPLMLLQWLSSHIPGETVCSSVKFGLESAIISMVAGTQERTIKGFLRPGPLRDIHAAGLLQGTSAEVVRQAKFLCSKGYTTFKLKVGTRNIPIDVRKVEDVRAVIGSGCRLRLDANRGWRLDEALVFAQNIGKDRIEYIEEPVADPLQQEEFFRRTDIPVAVDETMMDTKFEHIAGKDGVDYAVIRPMAIGGITGFLSIMEKAELMNVHVIVASAFETGVGMTALANLVAMSSEVANLGTANWFDEDLLLRPVVVDGGRVPNDRLSLEVRFFHKDFAAQLKAT